MSRHKSAASATMILATMSIVARGGATVPTMTPAASRSAQRSNLTGGLRSRSGPARDGPLDRCKGVDLLDGLGPDARNFLELLYGLEFSVGLPVIDDALGGRRPDLG